jgi:benzoyl-CoA 2,3-dioxygenase component B
VPLRNAMNEVLRDNYVTDCERAFASGTAPSRRSGSPTRLSLPSRRFHRHQGIYADHSFDPQGNLIDGRATRPTSAAGC